MRISSSSSLLGQLLLFIFCKEVKMNKFTKKMVADYAEKLLIGLTEEETKMVLDEFEIID